jgi:hypothetical protein
MSQFYGTVQLPIAKSQTIVRETISTVGLLFGSWVESGSEDSQLEELYKSRLFPSGTFNE